MKQLVPDTARQPQPPTPIKEQTDVRTAQMIVRIPTNQVKRDFFPGLPVSHLGRFDALGLEEYCLDGRANRLYKPHVHARGKPFNHGFRAKGL